MSILPTLNNGRVLEETLSTAGWYSESVIASSTPNAVVVPRGVAVGGNGQVYIASGAWFNGDTLLPGVLYVETPSSGGYAQTIIPTPGVNMLEWGRGRWERKRLYCPG